MRFLILLVLICRGAGLYADAKDDPQGALEGLLGLVAHIHTCYESLTGKIMKSLSRAYCPPAQPVSTVPTNFTINTQECIMEIPEYLLLFPGEGDFVVEPRFKGGRGMITRRKMAATDVNQLITPDQTGFYREMYFDDHLLHIMRYVIYPQKRIMTIWAKT